MNFGLNIVNKFRGLKFFFVSFLKFALNACLVSIATTLPLILFKLSENAKAT
jgi:hypothetical protein